MKYFLITYKDLKNKGIERKTRVTLSKDTGDISIDAKAALGVFINSTGTLKRNEIISLQELNENGNFIGEPITPQESVIMPTVNF